MRHDEAFLQENKGPGADVGSCVVAVGHSHARVMLEGKAQELKEAYKDDFLDSWRPLILGGRPSLVGWRPFLEVLWIHCFYYPGSLGLAN